MSGARAAIDVGSNSLLLTVVDGAGRVLHDEVQIVGLGRGLGDFGRMQPERRARGAEVLRAFVATAAGFGVPARDIRAAATSGARRAADAPAFFEGLRAELGLWVRTISGEEEARLSYLGALGGLRLPAGPVWVLDLGGGSTEVVQGEGAIDWRVSLEIGAVRLTEAHVPLEAGPPLPRGPLREAIARAVEEGLPPQRTRPAAVVAVAGTATTLAAMDLGLTAYDAARVHGHALALDRLAALSDALSASGAEARRRLAAVAPERADFLMAGAEVLLRLGREAGVEALIASNGGLRFGLLAEDFSAPT